MCIQSISAKYKYKKFKKLQLKNENISERRNEKKKNRTDAFAKQSYSIFPYNSIINA